ACLSVRGNGDFHGDGDFAVFLAAHFQSVVVDLFVGARVGGGVAGDGIVLAVKLAGPLVLERFAVGAGAFDRDFDAVARGFVNDGAVFAQAGAQLGLGFVELPGTVKSVGGKSCGGGEQERAQGHGDDFESH